jgi:cytochrome c551/c552
MTLCTLSVAVPGSATQNAGGNGVVLSLSCPSTGNCAAGGYFTDGSSRNQAFVASERNGRWANAVELPGSAALNAGGNAQVLSVSCPSAGNCSAGGYYTDHALHDQAFVASERNGRWGKAVEVPGSAALNPHAKAWVYSVSCPSAGNCAAGGYYTDSSYDIQAFVVNERNGRWGTVIEVPGSAALNAGANAVVLSVSCPSAGNCTAAGDYADRSARFQAFVASEQNGRWGNAIKLPGTAALNAGGIASVNWVSCPSAGNCVAGGYYTDHAFRNQAFVATERNGRWGSAIKLPGTAALDAGGNAQVVSVSCPSAGNCSAGGYYTNHARGIQAFVASERSGRWGDAIEVPGLAALNAGGNAQVLSVSCPSVGTCAAGGEYADRSSRFQAFVATERNGRWGSAMEVPASAALNAGGNAQVFSVSCPTAGSCAAGGYYTDSSSGSQAFVATERNGRWGSAFKVP